MATCAFIEPADANAITTIRRACFILDSKRFKALPRKAAVSHITIAITSFGTKLLLRFDTVQRSLVRQVKYTFSGTRAKAGQHYELQAAIQRNPLELTLGGERCTRRAFDCRTLKSVVKRTLQNLANVLGGEAAVRAANLTAALAIARLHGPAVLGLYGACLAVVTIVFMFADSGLQLSAITEIGSVYRPASRVAGELYVSKVILSAFAVGFLLAVGVYGNFPHSYWVIGGLIAVRTLIQSSSQVQIAILKSLFRMYLIGLIQAVHAGVLFLGIGIAFIQRWSITSFLELLVVGQALELLLVSGAVFFAGIRPRWPVFSSCVALMRRSVLLGLGYALGNLIVRLDVVVLSLVVALPELGQFSAADNLLVVAYLAAWLFGSVLLPEMVKLSDSADLLEQLRNRWIRITYKAIVPAALVVSLIAPRILTTLYGLDFARAGGLASWMVLACPFIFFNSLSLHHTIATGAKRAYLKIMFITALSAVVLNFLLAHYFGSAGVTAAILIRESLLSAVLWLRHSRARATSVEIGVSVPS